MPGFDRKIDPVAGDYIADGKGSYQKTTDISPAMWHQLQTKRGEWVGDIQAGSFLHLLEREGNTEKTARRGGDFVRQALKPFIDAGLAANLQVSTERDVAGRVKLLSTIHDVQHGQPLDVTQLLPGGP